MRFLTNWRINLANVPAYVDFNQDFTEQIDYALATLLLESPDERLAPESKEEFRKLVALIDRTSNTLRVKYSPRYGLGRRYAECPEPTYADGRPNPVFGKYHSALIAMPRVVKNTLYHYQGWRDYDQVKGHPTLLFAVAKKNGKRLPAYEDYLKEGRFAEIVAELSAFYTADPENPLSKKDIKWLFNKTIYGGGFKEWIKDIQTGKKKDHLGKVIEIRPPKEVQNADQQHPIYQAFHRDTQSVISLVYENNADIAVKVCGDIPDTEANLWKRRNRVMSYFCGILENEITFQAYKYACANGMCEKRKISWGYDGFTIPPPPAYFDEAFHLNALNEFVREKVGLAEITFIRKEFEAEEILQECLDLRRATADAVPVVAEVLGEAVVEPPEPSDQDEAYLAWKENFEKEWCKIKNTACFMRTCSLADGKFEKFILQTEKQLVSAYKHECYTKVGENGKSKKVSCVKEWLEDPEMLCYDDAEVYPPPMVCPPNKFNLWRPFAFQDDDMTADHPDYDAEGVQMWCDHLKILCNHEQPVFEYVSCWVAHSVQFPAVKPECMITFVSDEGIGKNIFTSSLSAIYGAGKKLETPTPERECWGSFNTPMASAFLVVLSETDKRNTGGPEGKIKALITDPPLVINPKGKDQYTITSYHRLITNSNSADPTKTHKGDRRNLIIRCSDEKKGDEVYFATLTERLSRPNTLRSIYACLKATDLSEWSFRKVPRTIYHETIIEGNRPALEIFLEHFTINNRDAPNGEMNLYGTQMLQHFRKWKEETGYAFDEKISEGILVKRLLTELKLPADTITKLGRGKRGIKRRYDMVKLKARFGILDGFQGQPYHTDANGHLVENEILEQEDDDGVETENEEDAGI
jgi:hypothetical protein